MGVCVHHGNSYVPSQKLQAWHCLCSSPMCQIKPFIKRLSWSCCQNHHPLLSKDKVQGYNYLSQKHFQVECQIDADFSGLWNVKHDQYPTYVKCRNGRVPRKTWQKLSFIGVCTTYTFLYILTSLLVFVPCLEVIFFTNNHFLLYICKYPTSTHIFSLKMLFQFWVRYVVVILIS